MAYTLAWYESIFQFVDQGGNTTTRTHRLREADDAGDISALIDAQNALLADYVAVSNAAVVSIRLARLTLNDALVLPTVGEVENNARITAFITGHPNKSATFDIPAPKDTLFVGAPGSGKNYNIVDTADAALVGWLDNFTGTTPPYLVSDGETITQSGDQGKRVHKKSNKG